MMSDFKKFVQKNPIKNKISKNEKEEFLKELSSNLLKKNIKQMPITIIPPEQNQKFINDLKKQISKTHSQPQARL
jgi:hypothetical protein